MTGEIELLSGRALTQYVGHDAAGLVGRQPIGLAGRPTRTRVIMCGHSFAANENFAVTDGGLPTFGNRMEGK